VGYGKVLVNCLWIGVLYLGVAAGLTALDGWLARISGAPRHLES
jgi:phosphatidylglycerophosphate synthase